MTASTNVLIDDRTAKPAPKLTAKQARDLADATAAHAAARAKEQTAYEALKKVRDRLRHRVPAGEAITRGGVTVKRTEYVVPAYTVDEQERERWTVNR